MNTCKYRLILFAAMPNKNFVAEFFAAAPFFQRVSRKAFPTNMTTLSNFPFFAYCAWFRNVGTDKFSFMTVIFCTSQYIIHAGHRN